MFLSGQDRLHNSGSNLFNLSQLYERTVSMFHMYAKAMTIFATVWLSTLHASCFMIDKLIRKHKYLSHGIFLNEEHLQIGNCKWKSKNIVVFVCTCSFKQTRFLTVTFSEKTKVLIEAILCNMIG